MLVSLESFWMQNKNKEVLVTLWKHLFTFGTMKKNWYEWTVHLYALEQSHVKGNSLGNGYGNYLYAFNLVLYQFVSYLIHLLSYRNMKPEVRKAQREQAIRFVHRFLPDIFLYCTSMIFIVRILHVIHYPNVLQNLLLLSTKHLMNINYYF